MIKQLFWKTYRAKYTNIDRSLVSYEFFRGFTWEVIEMAMKEAKEKTEKAKQPFCLEKLERIY